MQPLTRVRQLERLLTVAAALSVSCGCGWAQENRSRPFRAGACGPADPSYIRVAEQTGGIPFFFQKSEVGKAMRFAEVMSGENRVTMFWATGDLLSAGREFLVPLDSTLKQAIFTLSVDNHVSTMEVFTPAGVPITSADTSTEITELQCGRFVILRNPTPGLYRLRVQGSGRFWMEVAGSSEVFLHGVRFVELRGRPGHQGLFPISGQPLVSKPAKLEANVSGPVQTVAFALVSKMNKQIMPLRMDTVDVDADDREFLGKLELPLSPFRISVTGEDVNGHRYQRVSNPLFHATTIGLSLVEAPQAIPVGKTTRFTYEVSNLGNRAIFHVVASCGRSFATNVEPSDITLRGGETARLRVSVTVPEGTPRSTGSDLTVTVASGADSTISNDTTHHFSVSPEGP